MRTDFPVVLRRLIAMRACAAGDGFQRIDEIIARDGVDHQTNQQQGDDPHEKHDLLLFDDPRISGVIKDFVKNVKRVDEDS